MTNVRTNWLRFGALVSPPAPFPPDTPLLFTRHSLHLPRYTPHDRWGPPPMPRAEPGTALPPGRGSTCYDMLRFRVPAEVWRA